MIITKIFLDKLLDSENMQRYRDGKTMLVLSEHVVKFAYELVGLDHLSALKKVGDKMDQEEKVSLSNRNKYVVFYRALRNEVDYGFKVGDTVNYWYSPHTQRTGPILEILGGQARFADVTVPLTWVSKFEKEPEQITLDI